MKIVYDSVEGYDDDDHGTCPYCNFDWIRPYSEDPKEPPEVCKHMRFYVVISVDELGDDQDAPKTDYFRFYNEWDIETFKKHYQKMSKEWPGYTQATRNIAEICKSMKPNPIDQLIIYDFSWTAGPGGASGQFCVGVKK
jgi:hypothetical protein